jgi:uncharacterized protein YihD (DUF1040 family)
VNEEGVIQSFLSEEDRVRGQDLLKKLADEYKDAIDERQKEINIYNEILHEEVEVEIIPCKFEYIPNDFNIAVLRSLIKETDDELEDLL